jgi:hypothetical protein
MNPDMLKVIKWLIIGTVIIVCAKFHCRRY